MTKAQEKRDADRILILRGILNNPFALSSSRRKALEELKYLKLVNKVVK